MSGDALDVWLDSDRLWYWRFRSDGKAEGDDVALRSSRGYLSSREAADAASVAYPDLTVDISEPPESTARRLVGRLRVGCLVVLAGLVAVLLVRRLASVRPS